MKPLSKVMHMKHMTPLQAFKIDSIKDYAGIMNSCQPTKTCVGPCWPIWVPRKAASMEIKYRRNAQGNSMNMMGGPGPRELFF